MKLRQAKKILRNGKGGRTSRINGYWYLRCVELFGLTKVDHRIKKAVTTLRKHKIERI